MCGCQLTATAYVGAPEEGHTVSPFAHNRFRWFDGKIVKDQIEGRLAENWWINVVKCSFGMTCPVIRRA